MASSGVDDATSRRPPAREMMLHAPKCSVLTARPDEGKSRAMAAPNRLPKAKPLHRPGRHAIVHLSCNVLAQATLPRHTRAPKCPRGMDISPARKNQKNSSKSRKTRLKSSPPIIAFCMKEQKELGKNGTTKFQTGPGDTASTGQFRRQWRNANWSILSPLQTFGAYPRRTQSQDGHASIEFSIPTRGRISAASACVNVVVHWYEECA